MSRWASGRGLVTCLIFATRSGVKAEATAEAEVSDSILNEAILTYSIYTETGSSTPLYPPTKPATKSKPPVVAEVE
jgi:hypothetical protein